MTEEMQIPPAAAGSLRMTFPEQPTLCFAKDGAPGKKNESIEGIPCDNIRASNGDDAFSI